VRDIRKKRKNGSKRTRKQRHARSGVKRVRVGSPFIFGGSFPCAQQGSFLLGCGRVGGRRYDGVICVRCHKDDHVGRDGFRLQERKRDGGSIDRRSVRVVLSSACRVVKVSSQDSALALRFAFGERCAKPVETLEQTISCRRTCGLDVPLAISDLVEAQALGDLVH